MVRRGPLAPLLGHAPPEPADALRSVRFAFAALFLAQTALAVAVGLVLAAIAGTRPRPDAVTATVLLTMAVLHLPVGAALTWRVAGGVGRGAALAAATTAAVVLSAPAWFAALLAAAGQSASYVGMGMAVLALAYLVGFALTPRCAAAALRTLPERGPTATPASPSTRSDRPQEAT